MSISASRPRPAVLGWRRCFQHSMLDVDISGVGKGVGEGRPSTHLNSECESPTLFSQ